MQGGAALRFPDNCPPYTSIFLQEEEQLNQILKDMPNWFSTGSKKVVVTEISSDQKSPASQAEKPKVRSELKRWLVDLIRPLQKGDMSKDAIFARAEAVFGSRISRRMFDGIWQDSLREAGRDDLAQPGRRKSSHLNL